MQKIAHILFGCLAIIVLYSTWITADTIEEKFGWTAYCLGLVYYLQLYYFACYSRLRHHPLVLLLVFQSMLFYGMSWIFHWFQPLNYYENRLHRFLTPEDYEKGLALLILFNLAVYLGFLLNPFRYKDTSRPENQFCASHLQRAVSYSRLFFFTAVCCHLFLVFYLGFGGETTGRESSFMAQGTFQRFLVLLMGILFNYEMLFFIFTCFLFQFARTRSTFPYLALGITSVVACLVRVSTGSRSGIYEIGIILICVFITFVDLRKFRLNISRKLIVWTFTILLLAPASYYYGTIMRYLVWTPAEGELFSDRKVDEIVEEQFANTSVVKAIFTRLNLLDSYMIVVNNIAYNPRSEYVNFPQTFKSSVNRVVPGDLFTKTLWTEKAFAVIYQGKTVEEVWASNHGDFFGFYGISFVLFGAAGAWAFILMSSLAFSMLWSILGYLKFGPFYRALLAFIFFKWLGMIGIDNFIARMFYFIFAWIGIFWIIFGISQTVKTPLKTPKDTAAPQPSASE